MTRFLLIYQALAQCGPNSANFGTTPMSDSTNGIIIAQVTGQYPNNLAQGLAKNP